MVDFGTDIESSWSSNTNGDFKIISDTENAEQAIRNRLLTRYDELESLGYEGYGNKSSDVPGMTDLDLAKAYLRLYTEECLLREPRVQEIINISVSYHNRAMTIDISLKMIDTDTTTNLVITQSMEA